MIYGLFREGIYYCAALKQGSAEDGGNFDERGDECALIGLKDTFFVKKANKS